MFKEEVRSYFGPPLNFMSVQCPGPHDQPRIAPRYIDTMKKAGLENMRSCAYSEEYSDLRGH